MKIIIAPQNFKGSLTAYDAAVAIEKGVLETCPDAQTILIPVADGGDGTLDALVTGTDGAIYECEVSDPLGREILANWGVMGDGVTAVIEMARASGLALLERAERDPFVTSTYGVGQLILEAINEGYKKIIIGLGGSATNDGGIGMAQCLGYRFIDEYGNPVMPTGKSLNAIKKIDLSNVDERIFETQFIGASDVTNMLCGEEGAAAIFGPQKGATEEGIKSLDNGLRNLAEIILRDLNIDVLTTVSSGAAGGLGAGILAFLKGELHSGIDMVAGTLGLENNIESSDLIITGEGQTDRSSIFDKGPVGVAKIGAKYGVPTVILTGSLGRGYRQVYRYGVTAVIPISDRPMRFEVSLQRTRQLLQSTAERVMRLLVLGENINRN
ncbi:MAG: Glycerate 2-kinase [Chloroflexota bacterium]|nr:MAG: Glycerate 2-kinase [Chloroflexota bacterium]